MNEMKRVSENGLRKEVKLQKRIGKEKYKSSSSSRGCGFVKKSNKSHKHAKKKSIGGGKISFEFCGNVEMGKWHEENG